MNRRVALSKHTESPGKVKAGWQRLREVHLGVSLLNMRKYKVGRAFAALRRKSTKLGGTAEHNFRPFTGTEVFIF